MSLPDNYFTNKSKPYIVTDDDLDKIVNDVNDALFVDGSRKMTGDLDLDNNQLLNSGNITMSGTSTVDGVDVSEVLILYKDVTDVDYNDSFPLTLFSLPAEYRIQSMIIYVGTAFNGSEIFFVGSMTWSSGGDLNTARRYLSGCGTQTAGLSFGGYNGSYLTTTEEYNGTSWSAGGDLNTARGYLGGCGTQTAGLSFGGNVGLVTEEYNGTSWSAGGDLNTARRGLAGCGTQTAGLSFGGWTGSYSAATEEYNGTSWSSGGSLNTARRDLAGCGTQTTGLSFGGFNGSYLATTEEYNGTSWSAGGDLNITRRDLAGCGTQTAGLSFGGSAGSVTEEYNGTSWSAGGDLNTARSYLGGCGTQSDGLSFGGDSGSYSAVTEEYTKRTFIEDFAPSSTGFISTTKGDDLDVNKGMLSIDSATNVKVYEVSGSGSTTGQFTVYITYEKMQS